MFEYIIYPSSISLKENWARRIEAEPKTPGKSDCLTKFAIGVFIPILLFRNLDDQLNSNGSIANEQQTRNNTFQHVFFSWINDRFEMFATVTVSL